LGADTDERLLFRDLTVKITIYILVCTSLLSFFGFLIVSFEQEIAPIDPINSPIFTSDQKEEGEYLAAIGDCAACHTGSKGEEFAGGVPLPTPFGTIYSTNISPDIQTGIGSWSLIAFKRAMREGIDRYGNHLYPAFPYDHFVKTSDSDLEALYAYLMSIEPISKTNAENELRFPFSLRPLLAGWKLLFLDENPYKYSVELSEEENRGAYLALSLGHCGACHSPRNVFGAVIASKEFQGGFVEGWDVPPLAEHSISPIPWTLDNYVNYLFDGWDEEHGIATGPMTPVVDHLYDAREDDIFAIAAWLNSRKLDNTIEDFDTKLAQISSLDWTEPETLSVLKTEKSLELSEGENLFKTNCIKCHKKRISKSQPVSLGLTFTMNSQSPRNLFNVILNGIEPPFASSKRKMDAISLTKEEIVALAKYLRWRFTDLPEWKNVTSIAESALNEMH
jgi:mono/diheme cytochrome c family protein